MLRTRAAVLAAARTLFLRHGYGGTTMEVIAAEAGLTKRTLYNNYGDKDTLFRQMVDDTVAYAESFARGLHQEFAVGITKANVAASLEALGVRLALGIIRPEVVALRRMIIGESRDFPAIGREIRSRARAGAARAREGVHHSHAPAHPAGARRAECGCAIRVSRSRCAPRPCCHDR